MYVIPHVLRLVSNLPSETYPFYQRTESIYLSTPQRPKLPSVRIGHATCSPLIGEKSEIPRREGDCPHQQQRPCEHQCILD